jgi:hypothetical protein
MMARTKRTAQLYCFEILCIILWTSSYFNDFSLGAYVHASKSYQFLNIHCNDMPYLSSAITYVYHNFSGCDIEH